MQGPDPPEPVALLLLAPVALLLLAPIALLLDAPIALLLLAAVALLLEAPVELSLLDAPPFPALLLLAPEFTVRLEPPLLVFPPFDPVEPLVLVPAADPVLVEPVPVSVEPLPVPVEPPLPPLVAPPVVVSADALFEPVELPLPGPVAAPLVVLAAPLGFDAFPVPLAAPLGLEVPGPPFWPCGAMVPLGVPPSPSSEKSLKPRTSAQPDAVNIAPTNVQSDALESRSM